MTSLTLILALLPAALGYGAGSETNGPLSVAVIGGMLSYAAHVSRYPVSLLIIVRFFRAKKEN